MTSNNLLPASRVLATGSSTDIQTRTFAVANVTAQTQLLRRQSTRAVLAKLLMGEVESCSTPTAMLAAPHGFHGLIEVAHTAFAEHYGLELSPDDIWLTIAQGFANLVNREPETFRGKFVTHSGKEEIRIRRDQFVMGDFDNDWAGCFGEFSAAIAKYIGDEKHRLLVSDFTTTGPLQRAASEVVLMDTVQAYFKYVVETRCGIPFVKLLGSVADWQNLAQKVKGLAQFGDIGWWLDELHPIMNQFIAAASGTVDTEFWDDLYKGEEGSGSIEMTGWLLKLLPLTKDRSGNWQRNPLIGSADADGSAVTNRNLGASLSTVPFVWEYLGTSYDYQFVAGIVGYSQSESGDCLKPQMAWAVRPQPVKGS